MKTSEKIEEILHDIDALGDKEQLEILEKLILKLSPHTSSNTGIKLSDLQNLGSEVWKGVDLDNYIKEEREWD
ncbi:hypothetical protein [Aquiflexum gelatinilyticum]|uniref:hypothetical protein n=1 Tax=Aquiflexum gelatinilyticum TaxID=2961943 RepID=UPI00216815DF|nr:hypothetical protein [Aquiflexum gelatinilyticum]MCS4434984.1 hypothetical protein [Aquiflexum gelatinilyticum]